MCNVQFSCNFEIKWHRWKKRDYMASRSIFVETTGQLTQKRDVWSPYINITGLLKLILSQYCHQQHQGLNPRSVPVTVVKTVRSILLSDVLWHLLPFILHQQSRFGVRLSGIVTWCHYVVKYSNWRVDTQALTDISVIQVAERHLQPC
jgi:hypothetical protein